MRIPYNLACDRTKVKVPCPPGFECVGDASDECFCVPSNGNVPVRVTVTQNVNLSNPVYVAIKTLTSGTINGETTTSTTITNYQLTTAANLIRLKSTGVSLRSRVTQPHEGVPDEIVQTTLANFALPGYPFFFLGNSLTWRLRRQVPGPGQFGKGVCSGDGPLFLQRSVLIVTDLAFQEMFTLYDPWENGFDTLPTFPQPCIDRPETVPEQQGTQVSVQALTTVVGIAYDPVRNVLAEVEQSITEEIVDVTTCIVNGEQVAITTLDTDAGRELLQEAGELAEEVLEGDGTPPGQAQILSSIEWERQKRLNKIKRPGYQGQQCNLDP